jgi:hypothetical protein
MNDLEITQDLAYQKGFWKVQRVGWAVIACIMLAGLLGLFGGHGPLSDAAIGSPDRWQLDFPRFVRYESPVNLTMRFHPSSGGRSPTLWLDGAYLAAFRIDRVIPEPERVVMSAAGATYVFVAGDAARPTAVTIHATPQRIGLVAGRVGPAEPQALPFRQFIYP